MTMQKVEIYTDGGADPNPGYGGYAAILICGDHTREVSGGKPNQTNNRMEIQAAIEGLRALKYPCEVTVYSDSQLVIETMKGNYGMNKNHDLWQTLFEAAKPHTVTWVKVRGHNGNAWNERAHDLVQQAIRETRAADAET